MLISVVLDSVSVTYFNINWMMKNKDDFEYGYEIAEGWEVIRESLL